MVWKAGRVRWRRPGGTDGRFCGLGLDGGCWVEEGGMPCVVRRERISGFGRSKPSALRATLNSW